MTRPVIGITTSFNDNQQSVNWHYIRAIESAGGLPVIVPALTEPDAAQQLAAMLDGLVMTGGPGITTGLVGELPDDLPPVSAERDLSDRLIFGAMATQPVLGICYGMQFINAQHGGKIYADVMKQQAGSLAHSTKRDATEHPVKIAAGSHLHAIFQRDEITANTEHIQAVAEVGQGLQAVAFAPDGIIEAIESADRRLIGVQFHPERMGDDMIPLFKDFVARCKQQKS